MNWQQICGVGFDWKIIFNQQAICLNTARDIFKKFVCG
jgi:hypothetical protein